MVSLRRIETYDGQTGISLISSFGIYMHRLLVLCCNGRRLDGQQLRWITYPEVMCVPTNVCYRLTLKAMSESRESDVTQSMQVYAKSREA